MKIVVCKECKEERIHRAKGLCNTCYNRNTMQKPEQKKRAKENREKNKERDRKRIKEWSKKNKLRSKHNERIKIETDKKYRILKNLRSRVREAITKYSKTGKIMTATEYGINYETIIEHLKPFPKILSAYHIDHIKPLCSFDLENPEEVKKAFAPENHQWLTVEENLRKGGRF